MTTPNFESEEKEEPNQKEIIAEKLFDKENPEMITNLGVQDVDNISVLQTIVQSENEWREEQGLPKNIFEKVIDKNLVFRTSVKGWRAEQGVKVITALLDEDSKRDDEGLNSRLKRVIGRG